jgi:GntR family transcriptional regulator/MocR family aminotransferase
MKKPKRALENAAWVGISLDRYGSESLYMQLYELVKRKIEAGSLGAGIRLPSSRSFAAELGIARATVTAAYEQLVAEGYVSSRHGARLEVNELHTIPSASPAPLAPCPPVVKPAPPMLLTPGIPDARLFPNAAWIKSAIRSWRSGPGVVGDYDPAGAYQLRRAIAGHLLEWRGIEADPDQIIITAGSAGALQLILDTLTERGDAIAAEEPGYPAFHRLADRRGLRVALLPVDEEGMAVEALRDCSPKPRLCVVTPSHQYPAGVAMSIGRRRQLLEWAAECGALIVEDDYDSQFRYDGRPLPALLSVAPVGSVVYVGTTSKVFSPSMRIGYIVSPRHLVEPLRAMASDLEQRASIIPQYPLAHMIESGEYARHLRRMRRTHRERRRVLFNLLKLHVPRSYLEVRTQAAGLHALARLGPSLADVEDKVLEARCRTKGLGILALSSFYRGENKQQGLLLGFAAFDEKELTEGVRRLASAVLSE